MERVGGAIWKDLPKVAVPKETFTHLFQQRQHETVVKKTEVRRGREEGECVYVVRLVGKGGRRGGGKREGGGREGEEGEGGDVGWGGEGDMEEVPAQDGPTPPALPHRLRQRNQ